MGDLPQAFNMDVYRGWQRAQEFMNAEIEREVQRQDVVRDRRLRLKIIQDHDRQVDKAILFSGPGHIPLQGQQISSWFVSRDMSGDPLYILEYLGALLKLALPDNTVLDETDQKIRNRAWEPPHGPFTSHPNDLLDFSHAEHLKLKWLKEASRDPYDPKTGVPGGQNPPGNEDIWERIRNVFITLEHMQLLQRFVDPRNEETSQNPLPDGSNFENSDLRAAWVLHRAWIRALHYRSLYIGENDYGWRQIHSILRLTWGFHGGENIVIQKERLQRPEFSMLYNIVGSTGAAISGLTDDIFVETRPQPPNGVWKMEETVINNLQHENFEELWKKHFNNIDGMFWLWSLLLHRARDFETRMDVEHVEDTLVDKRIVVPDERFDLSTFMDGTDEPIDISALQAPQTTVLNVLAEISRVNRHRRNFLLLRDWSKRRPWKQLYFVVNTSEGEQDHLRQPIANFYAMIDGHAAIDPPPGPNRPSPSRNSNIWSSLFTFHPIASHDPLQLGNVLYDSGCIVCMDEFEPGVTIVQLHCAHIFHYNCVREYWDVPGRHSFKCPLCRSASSNWRLHDQVGITPETLDVWDNEDVTDPAYAAEHPDIQDDELMYRQNENIKLVAVQFWQIYFPGRPREVGIEMAAVREQRRRRNKMRREKIRAAGTGIRNFT